MVSRQSGAAELVREGFNGHVVDALDVDALAGAMAAIAKRGPLEMSEDARASVLDLGLDAMAARLVALYRKLLGGGA